MRAALKPMPHAVKSSVHAPKAAFSTTGYTGMLESATSCGAGVRALELGAGCGRTTGAGRHLKPPHGLKQSSISSGTNRVVRHLLRHGVGRRVLSIVGTYKSRPKQGNFAHYAKEDVKRNLP